MSTQTRDYVPLIDISRYTNPKSEEDKQAVIQEVREACLDPGCFQVTGHGVPVELQRELLLSIRRLMALPKEEKVAMSLKKDITRRGYEATGEQYQHGDVLPDAKEGFYLGREEEPENPLRFLRGPNKWPNMPEEEFKGPVSRYYEEIARMGTVMWELLVLSLGHPVSVIDELVNKPAIFMKLLRYPEHTFKDPRQFGAGPHTDFGGVTCLLQQPGKDGLEVWNAKKEEWVAIPALEDVFVINLGEMVQKWTGREYKAPLHRVLNKAHGERMSCACFWQGNLDACSPFLPQGTKGETVVEHLGSLFDKSFAIKEETKA